MIKNNIILNKIIIMISINIFEKINYDTKYNINIT